jgi:hypothetical protein
MNDSDVLFRLKTEIDDALGVHLDEPWQQAQFARFATALVNSKVGLHEFSLVAPHIGLGRAYDRDDLLEGQLSEALPGLSEAERLELGAHYEMQVEGMKQKYPDLI